MRKLISLAFGVMFAFTAMAGGRSFVQLTFLSGGQAVIAGTEQLEMSSGYDPSGQTFMITVNNMTYEFFDLKELRFLDEAQGIGSDETVEKGLSFRLYDKCVEISGEELSDVRAYTVDGKSVSVSVQRGAESVTVDFSSYPSGIYIVKTKTNSIKVSIR